MILLSDKNFAIVLNGFRLLNSEIGNDQVVAEKLDVPWSRFSSP